MEIGDVARNPGLADRRRQAGRPVDVERIEAALELADVIEVRIEDAAVGDAEAGAEETEAPGDRVEHAAPGGAEAHQRGIGPGVGHHAGEDAIERGAWVALGGDPLA
jgi:hypothetical protein